MVLFPALLAPNSRVMGFSSTRTRSEMPLKFSISMAVMRMLWPWGYSTAPEKPVATGSIAIGVMRCMRICINLLVCKGVMSAY